MHLFFSHNNTETKVSTRKNLKKSNSMTFFWNLRRIITSVPIEKTFKIKFLMNGRVTHSEMINIVQIPIWITAQITQISYQNNKSQLTKPFFRFQLIIYSISDHQKYSLGHRTWTHGPFIQMFPKPFNYYSTNSHMYFDLFAHQNVTFGIDRIKLKPQWNYDYYYSLFTHRHTYGFGILDDFGLIFVFSTH